MKLRSSWTLILAVLIGAAFVAVAPAHAQKVSDPADAADAPHDAPMPLDPKITTGQLDNGLRYWIRENEWPANRAELRLVVNAGSVLEEEDQRGLAHFVEHMAFNGTEHFPKQQLVEALESFGMRFGADINAYTSFDETVYWLRVPTDSEEILGTAMQILDDWASAVSFDPVEIDKERGVVIEEWRLGLGAGSRLRDQQFPILFEGSRYAERLPIGTLEVLEEFERDELVSFYEDWYRPDLMAVIAVGDFDADVMEERIRERFGDVPMPEDPRPRPVYDLPERQGTSFGIATDPEATSTTVSVFHLLPIREQGTHATYRQSLVEQLYHSMFDRRLAEVAQSPEAPFLGASSSQEIFIPTREVYVLGAAVPEGGVAGGLEALYREAERVERYGFTESELEREKQQFLRLFERIYTERETQNSRLFAEEFTRAFLEGESTPGIEYEWALWQRFIPEISLGEVNQVGGFFLGEDDRVVLVSAPESQRDGLPGADELLSVLEEVEDRRVEPYEDTVVDASLVEDPPEPGSIVEQRRIEELGVTEWELSNGATVVLKPTDFRQDQVLFHAFSPGGTSLAPDDDWVAASSATQVVSAAGFGELSARQITNLLSGKVVDVTPTFDPLEEGMIGGASTQDLETMFQLTWLKFTSPRRDPGVFRLLQEQLRARLENRDVSPEVAFREELQRAVTRDHPRRRPVTAELVDEMDWRTSFEFYKERFADASDFTFVFVGSFEPEQLRPLVERYLASLPSLDREESWRDEGVDPPAGVVRRVVHAGIEPKSLTSIVFAGPFDFDREERTHVGAMAQVLQVRLRESLREELGGTYSVRVDESLSRFPDPEYSVHINFGSDPERAEELTEQVFAEIERIAESGPTETEVENVRETMRRSWELGQERNEFWLGRLVDTYRRDADPSEILEFEERLADVTAEAIREAARTYLDTERYVLVRLLPAEEEVR